MLLLAPEFTIFKIIIDQMNVMMMSENLYQSDLAAISTTHDKHNMNTYT